jgi:hypothetical protein
LFQTSVDGGSKSLVPLTALINLGNSMLARVRTRTSETERGVGKRSWLAVRARADRETYPTFGERSQWLVRRAGERAIEKRRKGCIFSGFGVVAAAMELAMGPVPGAFERGQLTLDPGEEFGGGTVAEEDGAEVGAGGLGEEGAIELRLDAAKAPLVPIGADHGVDVEGFGRVGRAEAGVVVADEGLVFGGIFAGDDNGFGVEAVLECVEAGGGLARIGAGSGRFLRVGAIGGDLCWCSHD